MRLVYHTTSLGLCAALVLADAAGAGRARPATRPASTRPAGGRVSEQTKATVTRCMAALAGSSYHARRKARENLKKLLNTPGVDDLLMERLKSATDPQVKATLEGMLTAYGQPLVMVWRHGRVIRLGSGIRSESQHAGAPSLLVRGDGTFLYNAASACFTGEAESRNRYRQGRLAPAPLFRLKQTIADSGVLRVPVNPRASYGATRGAGIHVAFHVRSGNARRMSMAFWPLKVLKRTRPRPGKPPADAELRLAVALADLVASAPSKPYDGPLAIHAERDRSVIGNDAARLPKWPLGDIDLRAAMKPCGVPLGKKDLDRVRQRLTGTNLYQYARYAACRVVLVPSLKEIQDLYYGMGR